MCPFSPMDTPNQPDLFPGEVLKAEGITRVHLHNQDWVQHAAAEIRRLARTNEEVTADSLRSFIAQFGEPKHPNAIGAAFCIVANQGEIYRAGFKKSSYASNHGRFITVWKAARL